MIKFYHSRELSEKLKINLAKWKRWSREFLAPDPLGGLQSGYARQYNLDDAFTVYLGGYLVAALKFSIPEAKQILSDLRDWMLRNNFFYYFNYVNAEKTDVNPPGGNVCICIAADSTGCGRAPQFFYFIKRVLANEPAAMADGNVRCEHYVAEIIGAASKTGACETEIQCGLMGARVLYLTHLHTKFLTALGMAGDGMPPVSA